MCSANTINLFKNVLSSVERLNVDNVVLPNRLAKKPFAQYCKENASHRDESADHTNVSFTYTDHANLEIVFGLSGRAEFVLAGQRYTLAEGEMAIVPPRTVHLERILSRLQSYSLLWLNVKPDRLFIHSAVYNRGDRFQTVRYAALANKGVSQSFENAALEAQSGESYWLNLFRARLIDGWVQTLRTVETEGTGLNERQVRRNTIDRAKAFMQSNFCRALSLDQIANSVFLSPAYFSSFFSQHEHMTVVDYLHKLRINEAKRLLKHTSLSTKEIARRVGIPSISYFCRLFRRSTGISAQEFRAQAAT